MVSGFENGAPTNLPLDQATVEVYAVDPETGLRQGPPAFRQVTGTDGRWGPFTADATAYYEFVVAAQGYPTTHVYRTPFPRSLDCVQLRLAPIDAAYAKAGSVVTLIRPRGYLAHGRNRFTIDGTEPPGVADGVPAVDQVSRTFDAGPARSVPVGLDGARMTVRTFPRAEGHIVFADFND